jgi:multiple sugar transport system ATP-binding protein
LRLRLENLKKEFSSLRGRVTAVDGLEFEVADSEFFVLLGPSGCGKSTALNLIAGLEKPTAGEVWFNDRLVASMEKRVFLLPKERNVAMVFQDYALYPHLSVFENIAFPLRIARLGRARVEKAVQRTAARLDIKDLLAAKPAELSGGQRQRVAIARAIVREPDIFLLDEPLSNLDARLRAQTRTELRSLQKSLGITTVYVTHDQIEALTLGDRVAVLKEGRVAQIGSPRELYDAPVNAFVAGFIGTPPMNILQATVRRESGRLWLSVGDLKLAFPEKKIGSQAITREGACLFGIRPEHIEVTFADERGSHRGLIHRAEPTGRDIIIHLSVEGCVVSAIARAGEYREGEEVYVKFDMARSHIFPPE